MCEASAVCPSASERIRVAVSIVVQSYPNRLRDLVGRLAFQWLQCDSPMGANAMPDAGQWRGIVGLGRVMPCRASLSVLDGATLGLIGPMRLWALR